MGRPKKVPDEAVLEAVGRAIGRRGPDGFTIREVAQDTGIAPATVMQRFGSRRRLLRAFVQGGVARLDAAFAPRPGDRVADVLVRAFGADVAHAPRTGEMANHIAMLAADLGDPHLRRATRAHFVRVRAGIGSLLRDAVRTGGLRPIDDLTGLARTLEATCHGTLVVWAVVPQGNLEDALRATIGTALRPFEPERSPTHHPL